MIESPGVALLLHPSAELYGSDRVFLESVNALVLAGNDVVVALPVTGPLEHELRIRGARVEICPSPVLRKSMFHPRSLLQTAGATVLGMRQGRQLIRRFRPSVIYVNTMTIPLWNILARLYRIPLVVHVHEGEASASAAMRMILATPLLLSTTLIANSRFSAGVIAGSLRRLGPRTTVVYNAVPGPSSPPAIRQSLTSAVRLMYVGRLSPRKGVDVAISALALLEQKGIGVELDLIGAVFPGYEWYEQELIEQVTALRLDKKVRFHGFVPSIWDHVAGCDMLLVPSLADEPFGNTAVEAILGGRPVIASNTTGLIEATAGYGAAKRVVPKDPHAIAAAVCELMAQWNEMPATLAEDLLIARTRHDLERYQQRIIEVVEKCQKSTRRAPRILESRKP